MKMYERMIRYKAVFLQDGQKEVVEYKEKGIYEDGDKKHISFDAQGKKIDITYDEKRVTLKNGDSMLRMHRDKEIWNEYLLPYGSVQLKTKVLMYSASHDAVKLKYELYDFKGLLMSVYILITMI